MSMVVSVKKRQAFSLIQIKSRQTIQAMDREREEKTPGHTPRGKTSGARGVTRGVDAEVEGFKKEDWDRAGDAARQLIAHTMYCVVRAERGRRR
jgi:hypothetical protein